MKPLLMLEEGPALGVLAADVETLVNIQRPSSEIIFANMDLLETKLSGDIMAQLGV